MVRTSEQPQASGPTATSRFTRDERTSEMLNRHGVARQRDIDPVIAGGPDQYRKRVRKEAEQGPGPFDRN